MFLGAFQHTLDEKGRLTLPAKFRKAFADGLVITKGFDNCLAIYTRAEWPQVETKIKSLQMFKKNARQLSRFFFGFASEERLDKSGRFVVPAQLRDHAQLGKDVVVVGVSDRLEVWSKSQWEGYSEQAEESYEEIAEALGDLGL